MSTPLGELDERPNVTDGDLVQKILSEMNGGSNAPLPSGGGLIQPPPAIGMGGGGNTMGMIPAPGPNSLTPHTMDNGPATAHMIGNSHPSPADFAQAMYGAGRPGGGGQQMHSAMEGMQGQNDYASYGEERRPQQAPKLPAKKSWTTKILNEFRIPFFVVIIVFLFSLTVINFLFAHYLPYVVKPTGELKMIGILIKAIAAGAFFWLIQRVIVPLLSL
jgi:hypothetical protein